MEDDAKQRSGLIKFLAEGATIGYGVLAGGAVGGLYGLSAETPPPPLTRFLLGVDGRLQWEVLLTGVAAIIAALLTVRAIRA